MIINFNVNGDTIKTSEKETFYTGNVNSYICEFDFSEDWNNAAAFCVMTNGKKSAVLYIADSKCTVPSEILSGKGTVKLGLYGTDGNKRISTNCVMLKVREGAYEIGADDMSIPIPDVWEQLVEKTVPKIGDNGNWFVWSMTENEYVDTGVYATVDIGEFYKKSETDEKLSGKVDKETGKGLSTNDFTDEEKEKLKGLSNYDDEELRTLLNGNVSLLENRLYNKVDKVQGKGLSSNDFTDEDKGKITNLENSFVENMGNIKNGIYDINIRLNKKEDTANKVTTLDIDSTDEQYPSAKCVYDELVNKEDSSNKITGIYSGCTDTQYPSAKAVYDALAMKANKQTITEGFEGGQDASAGDGAAIGANASAFTGGAVGAGAETRAGGAIGEYAKTDSGFSGGYLAQTVNDDGDLLNAIQLGTGTNPNEKTLQIYDYQLMDADGHIPNDRMPTKADKTTISTSTEATPSVTLADNREFVFTSDISELTIEFDYSANTLISSVVFNTGETAPEVILPAKSVYYIGANCGGYNSFTPVANRHYTMIFTYDSDQAICYVSAIPVSQAILFSTADTDESTVANNETVEETTEIANEEPESEPNEVI